MQTTDVFSIDGRQAVRLPDGYRFEQKTVSIRREGDIVILEPIRVVDWPAGFFDAIRVDDPNFIRPLQGEVPSLAAVVKE